MVDTSVNVKRVILTITLAKTIVMGVWRGSTVIATTVIVRMDMGSHIVSRMERDIEVLDKHMVGEEKVTFMVIEIMEE